METSLINLLCSAPSSQALPGSAAPQGKGADIGTFFGLLQNSLNETKAAADSGAPAGKTSGMNQLPSADALSKSLDIIDALAFLPVLLTTQQQGNSNPEVKTGASPYSTDTIGDLLDAIANALETGNVEDLKKTLEENKSFQDLLSGQKADASLVSLAATGSGSLNSTTRGNPTEEIGRQSGRSVSNAVASLIAALDTNDGQSVQVTPVTNDDTEKADPASTDRQSGRSVSNAVASLIAALDAVYTSASQESAPSLSEKETSGISTSKDREPHALAGRPGKAAAEENSSATTGNDDVVRNTMLLGAILPNLLTVKPETATADSASGRQAPNDVSQEFFSSIIMAGINKIQGSKGDAATNGAKKSTVPEASTGADQAKRTNGLSEDYVLLNKATVSRTEDADGVPVSDKAFEVLYANAKETAGGSKADSSPEQPSAPTNGTIQIPTDNGIAAGQSVKGDVHTGQTTQVSGHVSAKQNGTAEAVLSATEVTVHTEKTAIVASGEKENLFQDLKDREEKSSHGDVKVESSGTKGEANVLAHDSTKTASSPQKSGATGQATASMATTMAHKIEELAENYSNRNQSMDMVLRLKVDDKESIVVGLRTQGDKILVEVKGASDGLMSALQSQKDLITRELEGKHIYTTINVEIKGDGNPQGRGQREQRKQDGNENEKEDFRGILDTLA